MNWNEFDLRNYDPQIGRFLQVDPYDQFPSTYMGIGNDPINNIDPSGGIGINFGMIGQITGSVLADRALITLGGAALGFGIDKLTGGKGWTGAAIGGAVGLAATFIPPIDFGGIGGALKDAAPTTSLVTNVADNTLRRIVAEPEPVRVTPSTPSTILPDRLPSISIPPIAPPPSAPWMNTARGEYGVREATGNNDGPDVDKYLRTVGGAGTGWAWCAAFVNWTLLQNDIRGTGRPNALSYLNYGQTLREPAYGSIAVISHGKGLGHVGFVAGVSPSGSIVLLGGNQSNMVKYSSFSRASISRFVYPTGFTPSYQLPTITNTSVSSFSETR